MGDERARWGSRRAEGGGGRHTPALAVALSLSVGLLTAGVGGAAGADASPGSPAGLASVARGAQPHFTASPLYSIDYALVGDVSGSTVKKGDSITLTFAGGGKLCILATSPGGDLAYVGTWSYKSPMLDLIFKVSGFNKRARFKLNLSAKQILIPFHVFDSRKGNSLWNRQSIDPVVGAYAVADATAANTAKGLPIATIISAAGAYVAGVTGAKVSTGDGFVLPKTLGATQPAMGSRRLRLDTFGVVGKPSLVHLAALAESAPWGPAPTEPRGLVTAIELIASGLLLKFTLAGQLNVVIDSSDQPGGSAVPLTPALLFTDPRVHLHAQPPGIASGDPPVKKALFVDPFLNARYDGWSVIGGYYLPSVVPLSSSVPINVEKSTLKSDGYAVAQLANNEATVANIIGALKANPGVLMVETHGSADGSIATASYLGDSLSEAQYELHKLNATLKVQFGMPLNALEVGSIPSLSGTQYFALLTPAFWSWMETVKGLNLSRSLVYMGACYTDLAPALRDAIKARAYFAFQQEAFSPLVSAIGNYMIRLLARPTVTAEEVFYNMIRIDQTDQLIYKEDLAFIGTLFPQAHFYNGKSVKSAILGVLFAYFYDGSTMVSYIPHGWLSSSLNHAQVWYLVFVSRWGQNVITGVANLKSCWNNYWSNGQLGGLASPFCNSANIGVLPKKDEVYYAIYLVTGATGFSGGITPVERFTLNDGR